MNKQSKKGDTQMTKDKKKEKFQLLKANVFILANPSSAKKDHVFLAGKIAEENNNGSTTKYRVKHKSPWGMTSGWFDSDCVYVSLNTASDIYE
jgi:hypothetical protein